MYLNILKKDLKRKKTMNIILLLFISLSAMFVASSVNNIITVVNALDYYFEKADAPDYFMVTKDLITDAMISETLDDITEIDSYKIEKVYYANPDNFYLDGKTMAMKNSSVIMAFENRAVNFFDSENNIIESVEEGTVILSGKAMHNCNIEKGDIIVIRLEGVTLSLTVAGSCKDAILGSDMMGMTRFILNENDFRKFSENESISAMLGGSLCYINTENTGAVVKALGDIDSVIFANTIDVIKMTYVMDVIIAGILLVISVCLILIAFVVLRFTITFTLTEEYREIGIMKAIGIGNTKIRILYLVKYFMLAVTGSVIGFFGSIPFGNLLLKSVSESMVLGNDNAVITNILCCIGVVAVILLFSFNCTGKVKRFTPIDAIRSGTTGERFSKKSMLCLGKSSAKPSFFMALNDILSSPKRFGTVMLAYILCLSLVLILVNSVNTLKSDKLAAAFGIVETDVYLNHFESERMSFMTTGGEDKCREKLENIEKTLADNGMPTDCSIEILFKYSLTHGENSCKSITLQGMNTTADMYEYFEGTPPQNENEVAITPLISEKLDAQIGDTITIIHSFGEREYLVTALYQSMNNLGEGVRLHETAETDFVQTSGLLSFQLDFTDNPDKETVRERIEKIKDIYDTDNVYTAGEYVEKTIGVADMIESVKILTLSVVMVIIALVTILMERSFITKEKNEIALLKAVGFGIGSVIKWHTARFCIVGIISTVIALILTMPLTELMVTPIFEMMGAFYGVEYEINSLEVFVIYPLIVLAITIISALFTSLYTKTIKTSETSDIE